MPPFKPPVNEIKFAAQTGFLSRRLWNEFFAEGELSWRCKRWKSFQEKEFFRPHPSHFATDVLVLNSTNLLVKQLVGDALVSPPYISQLHHDETMARIILGLKKSKAIQSFETELELKKKTIGREGHLNPLDRIKYPDAAISVGQPGNKWKVALELELTRKDPKRYRQILSNYAAAKGVHKVIFITRSQVIVDSIQRSMREVYYPDWERPIGFGNLDNWIKNPDSAPIQFADSVTSIALLNQKVRLEGCPIIGN